MNSARTLIYKLSLVTPRFLWIWIYHAVATVAVLMIRLRFPGTQVYVRNSLHFGVIEPGFSDIDLTVVHFSLKASDIRKFWNTFGFLAPLVQEINIFDRKDIAGIEAEANRYELLRDPKTFSPKQLPSPAAALVYLQRHFERGSTQLAKHPEQVLRKWNFHLRHVTGRRNKIKNPAELLAAVLQTMDFLAREDLGRAPFPEEKEITSWKYALYYHHHCYLQAPKDLTDMQRLVIEEQIRWEILGLSAYRDTINEARLKKHVSNLFSSNFGIPLRDLEKFFYDRGFYDGPSRQEKPSNSPAQF